MVVYCLLFEGEIDAIDMRRMLPRIVGVSAIVAIFLVVIVIGSVFIFTGGRKKDDNKSIAATGNALDLNAIDFDITAPNLEEVKIVAPPAHKKRSNADLPLSLLRECKQYKEIKALIDRGELNESNNNGKVVINIELETREANAFVAFACALRQRTVLPEMEARDTIYVVPAINIIADTIRQSEEARQ
jgi:hypothetical protein